VNILPALIALALAQPALAAEPKSEDFAARFELATQGAGPHFRAALTADVIRYSQSPDLSDLRVFNAAADALPFALTASPSAEPPRETPVPLPVYPIEARVHRSAGAGGRMEIRQRGGATTVIVEGDRAPARAGDRVAAYLLDARGVKALGVAVELDAAFDRARLVPVTIEASRDLKSWRALAVGEPVFRLGEGEAQQTRTAVRFNRAEALEGQYLRLTWAHWSQFELRSAALLTIPAERALPAPPISVPLGAPARTDARQIEWNVPTPVRFAQLDVRLAETNALAPVTVLGRHRLGDPWIAIGRGVVYRIQRDGTDAFNPGLDVQPGSYQAIRLAFDGGGAFGTAVPEVALRVAPRDIVFLVRGAGPYVLATGNFKTDRAALPLATLIPGYKPEAERTFALATIGSATLDASRTPRPAATVFGIEARNAALWVTLFGAVAALALFSYSLMRKLKRAQARDG
jgi:hypothetical protein